MTLAIKEYGRHGIILWNGGRKVAIARHLADGWEVRQTRPSGPKRAGPRVEVFHGKTRPEALNIIKQLMEKEMQPLKVTLPSGTTYGGASLDHIAGMIDRDIRWQEYVSRATKSPKQRERCKSAMARLELDMAALRAMQEPKS